MVAALGAGHVSPAAAAEAEAAAPVLKLENGGSQKLAAVGGGEWAPAAGGASVFVLKVMIYYQT